MSTDPAPELEPPPFDDDGPTTRHARPWEPLAPMSPEDLDQIAARPPHLRTLNPWLCAFNLNAEDGIGYLSGHAFRQCPVHVADPTKSRYCLEHARQLNVDYYSPIETSEVTDAEVAASLTRIVPKAVKTLEAVMDDEEAPAGVRGRAATDVLDRTGYAKGLDVRIDAKVAVVDVTGIIADRLNALRDAQLRPAHGIPGVVTSVTDTPAATPDPLVLPPLPDDDDVHADTGEPGPGADPAPE